jgi:hypothetical protein
VWFNRKVKGELEHAKPRRQSNLTEPRVQRHRDVGKHESKFL